jgi:hypothetical protein
MTDRTSINDGPLAVGSADMMRIMGMITDRSQTGSAEKPMVADQDLLAFSRKLMEQDPSTQLFIPLVEEFCSRKLWRDAVETCRRGLLFHPRLFRGRVLLGWALWELGEVQESEQLLAEARKELEKNAIIYSILAELAERRGDHDQAWRLRHIYQSLQDGASSENAVQREASAIPDAPPEEKEQPPALVQILDKLLLKYENKNMKAPSSLHLFSNADRKLLQKIIDAGTS